MGIERTNNQNCPICLSDSRFWDEVNASTNLKNTDNKVRLFQIYKCNFCGHGFFSPGLESETELLKFYDENYAENYNPEIDDNSFKLRKNQYILDVNIIKNYFDKTNVSVLDIGCSTGQFLNVMPANWKKYGYEVNKFALNYIADRYKNIVTFSKLSEIENMTFDLITLRGVIEHFYDFKELFTSINKNIKRNGIVYICATPDFNSPCAVLYKSLWNQISAPLHYHQFTSASISILFAKNGFGLKALYYLYEDTPYAKIPDDATKFISNINRYLEKKDLTDTLHAYPGNIMSLIFIKLK